MKIDNQMAGMNMKLQRWVVSLPTDLSVFGKGMYLREI